MEFCRGISWKPALLAWSLALASWESHRDSSVPSIEFTKIPPAAQGRRETVDTIAGRVKNSRPGHQIVIYAQSGQWWVQRWPPYLGSRWRSLVSRPHIVARNATFSVLLVYFALTGCHSSSKLSAPTVAFSKVPAAYQESPYKTDITERDYKTDIMDGRVTGARPGQRIVLYAKTDGRWGVCRQSGQPFTNIESDGRWRASVHLGLQYAALLVDPTYYPPEQTESAPIVGNGVVTLAVVNGEGPAPVLPSPKTLNFSGYEWTANAGPMFHAGSRNFFDPANVWTDERGALHLRISGSPGKWSAAEVKLARSLGYGTYRFQVRDASHLEPSALLTLITWDGVGTENARRELDVELGRWGSIGNTNVHYVVQPYYVPANFVAFRVPPGVYTHSFRWEPGKVMFSTLPGSGNTGGRVINQHVFTSGVPSPEGESVRIALYVFHHGHRLKNENEAIIDKFEYLP